MREKSNKGKCWAGAKILDILQDYYFTQQAPTWATPSRQEPPPVYFSLGRSDSFRLIEIFPVRPFVHRPARLVDHI